MPNLAFSVAAFIVAIISGGVAALSGFGIGSLLTPVLATAVGMKVAVAAVSLPHFVATCVRLWGLRKHVDRRVLFHFGILSAVGGMLGALFQSKSNSPALSLVFAALLLFAGVSGLAGWSERMHFGRGTAWLAGALSGFFGGIVGNQGGIRSAALMGFQLSKESLVATATATGVLVDTARMPVYLATQGRALIPVATYIVLATVGCLIGTFWGVRVLERIPPHWYKRVLSSLICALGLYMALKTLL
jgi:uncharacterized membrane protein YfcA